MSDATSKRADLWESGVSTMVRDMQWIFRGSFPPETQLTLDGRAETALGDSFICANDKIFLLELKATASGKAADAEKDAHASILGAFRSGDMTDDKIAEIAPRLWESVRGHHFVYWENDPKQRGSKSKTGGLMLDPYIRDVAKRNKSSLSGYVRITLWLAAFGAEGSGEDVNLTEKLSLDRIFTNEAYAAVLDLDGELMNLGPVGLDPDDLQEYVKWLIRGQNGLDFPIHAILCSRDGAFFRQVSSLKEVAKILANLNRLPCESGALQSLKRSPESFSFSKTIPETLRESVRSHRRLRR